MSGPEGYVAADDFADPADPVMFPRLSPAQMSRIAAVAQSREFEAGEVVFQQGQPDLPFLVVEHGSLVFFDRRTGEDTYYARVSAGTFVGDIVVFTGAPSLATCRAAEQTRVLAMDRADLHTLIAESPDISDLLLTTMLARRAWLERHDYGSVQLVGSRWSQDTFRLRDLLGRNQIPYHWYDPDSDADGRTLLAEFGLAEPDLPVLISSGRVMRRPTVREVAAAAGLLPALRVQGDPPYDLVVVGAGPAGLAAAVYGASEGLATLVLDAEGPGGQAGTSSKIENYLGFAAGISGSELTRQATVQARKFGAVLSNPCPVSQLAHENGRHVVELTDGRQIPARTVVIATGAEYRRLDIDDLARFEGSGVYYAAQTPEATLCRGERVIVVGGGNSAGQAAMFMAQHAQSVCIAIRGSALSASMSQYLARRIEEAENIEVLTHTRVTALHGDRGLRAVTVTTSDGERQLEASAVFAMIGAVPRTGWLGADSDIAVDDDGFILTGSNIESTREATDSSPSRPPSYLETSRPGVFAVGDVRSGSIKRVASAVGEGSVAVTFVHQYLSTQST